METLTYSWRSGAEELALHMVPVPGTNGRPFRFGNPARHRSIEVPAFYIAATPVTQALWLHVMNDNPAVQQDPTCPVENVSWNDIVLPGGFLDRLNASDVLAIIARDAPGLRFRLLPRRSGSTRLEGAPDGRTAIRTAEATTLMLSRGTVHAGRARTNWQLGSSAGHVPGGRSGSCTCTSGGPARTPWR